jgi:hypothetical protein
LIQFVLTYILFLAFADVPFDSRAASAASSIAVLDG